MLWLWWFPVILIRHSAIFPQMPSETDVWAEEENIDPIQVHQAREALLNAVAVKFLPQWRELNRQAAEQENQADAAVRYEYSPELPAGALCAMRLQGIYPSC